MAIFKCKMCGGTIEFEPGASVGVCDSCGTKQTLPRLDDDRRANLYDRANHFRRNNDFDKAASIYEQILNEDPTDAEAYWSLVLCRYGIEYVEDPATRRRVPTVNRAQYTSIFDDADYRSALQYADAYQRSIYEAEANAINELQKGILAISQKEEPFDVFICYKETDANGRRTPDSVLANDLYHQLTQEGFKVFFSRITLEDKLGTAYEPYIFAALNSAKVMVVLGTRPEHFNAVWVKNEWSRYLTLVKQSGGKKTLIPAYKDMDPYDLPDEFSHLQAQDMSKLGFMQDLIRGIRKLAGADAPKQVVVQETAAPAATGGTAAASLLERAFMFLEDGKWTEADEYCEKVLDIEPKNARAYLGKLMAELRVRREDALRDAAQPFDGSDNCVKAARFDPALAAKLAEDNAHIRERNEQARQSGIYNGAVKAMDAANSEDAYKAAAKQFQSIPGFKDADALAEQCLEKAEVCRKDAVYDSAKSKMTGEKTEGYEAAIREFDTISGWKDADEQISVCQRKIEEIKAKEEADRLEAERKEEAEQREREKRRKKKNRIIVTLFGVFCVGVVVLVVVHGVLIPNKKYRAALELYSNGSYGEAITAFEALNGYKDSDIQIKHCETAIKEDVYVEAVDLLKDGKLFDAVRAFRSIDGFSDSVAKAEETEKKIIHSASVGELILFGTIEQDNELEGQEPIEWIVLEIKENKMLVISKNGYGDFQFDSSKTNATWEDCSLRSEMNGEFFNRLFSTDEQSLIVETNNLTVLQPGKVDEERFETVDKLFLESTEAQEFESILTQYKNERTIYDSYNYQYSQYSYYSGKKYATWPRDPAFPNQAGVDATDWGCIYPLMWISLE